MKIPFRRSAAMLPALGLLAFAAPGHAITTYCVHGAQELYSALHAASLSSDTPILVNIRKGSYHANDAQGPFAVAQGTSNQTIAISGGITFNRVHYGTRGGTPITDIAPGSGDPGFTAVGNPRPRADSILIDSGIASPDGGTSAFDIDGLPRSSGPAPDLGAYESELVFQSGFDL